MRHLDYPDPDVIMGSVEKNLKTRDLANKYWELIGKEVTQLVNELKSKPKLYQNDYGYYLQLFGSLEETKISKSILAYLMIKAGANHIGVMDAYQILNGGAKWS